MKNLIYTLIENDFSISGNKDELIVNNTFIIFPEDDGQSFGVTYKTNKRSINGSPIINKKQNKKLTDFIHSLLKDDIICIIDSDLIVKTF